MCSHPQEFAELGRGDDNCRLGVVLDVARHDFGIGGKRRAEENLVIGIGEVFSGIRRRHRLAKCPDVRKHGMDSVFREFQVIPPKDFFIFINHAL